jgi:hypothetical protein
LADELAAVVRALYVEVDNLRDRMLEAARDLDGVANVDEIRAAVNRVAQVAVPEPGVRLQQPQLDTARNELGEVLAYGLLEGPCAALLPAKRVREKEIPGLPSRGLDALALRDGPPLELLVSEVKTSDEVASPPRVVGQGTTSLHAQLRSLVTDTDRLLSELNWAYKHTTPDRQQLVARAMLLHTRDELALVGVPVLVRPARCHQDSDCGIFEQAPESIAPANVRFCVVRLARELDELAQAVYETARGGI